MSIPPKLIRLEGTSLQGYAHSAKRARELSVEVERLNRSVSEHAKRIEFEDEPSHFSVALARGGTGPAGGKRWKTR